MLLMVLNVFKKSNKKGKVFEKTKEKMKKSSKALLKNINEFQRTSTVMVLGAI